MKLNDIWKNARTKYEMEEIVFFILLALIPASLLIGGKLFKNILTPMLYLVFFYRINKKGFKKSFYEKLAGIFVFTVMISIIFTKHGRVNGVEKLLKDMVWITMPIIFGQFKLNMKAFKFVLYSTYVGYFVLFYRYLLEIQKGTLGYLKIKLGIGDILKYETWELILKLSGKMWRLGISGPFKYIAHNAAILSVIFIVILTYIFYIKDKKIEKILSLIILATVMFFLILTQSRSAYLSLMIISLFLILSSIAKMQKRYSFLILGILGMLILFLRNTPFGKRAKAITIVDQSNLGRLEVYNESFRIFKENMLTGVGYQNFFSEQVSNAYKIHSIYKHPHNLVLKFLSETGIFGFIGYFLMMLKMGFEFFKERKKFQGILGFLLIAFLLIFENFEILIFNYNLYAFIFIFISFSMNIFYEEK